jgi:endonuclease G
VDKDSIFVITGPVLHERDSTIGENQVAVPGFYFKVLADMSPPDHSFIAFLLPHEGSREDVLSFAITVDSLELFTGFDFFASMPNQEAVEWYEAQLDLRSWD